MKTIHKVVILVGIAGTTGLLAMRPGHHDIQFEDRSFSAVTFAQTVSEQDRQMVKSNLQKAFNPRQMIAEESTTKPVSSNPALVAEIRDRASIDRFRDLDLCLDERNPCDIPQIEPRSSDIWVADRAIRELQGIRAAFSQLSVQEQNSLRKDLEPATLWALDNLDDNIREEGMYLSRQVLPPEERVQAVIASLEDSVSAPLFDVGLSILREEKGTLTDRQVDFYVKTMETGGYYSSEEVARYILPYLNESNLERFVELHSKLRKDSNTATFLNDNIKEYRMISQGG